MRVRESLRGKERKKVEHALESSFFSQEKKDRRRVETANRGRRMGLM